MEGANYSIGLLGVPTLLGLEWTSPKRYGRCEDAKKRVGESRAEGWGSGVGGVVGGGYTVVCVCCLVALLFVQL